MGEKLDLDLFDRTVADIYEAAIDPGHWDIAMAGIINRTAPPRWDIAFLLWEQLRPPGGRFVGAFGVAEFARQGYLAAFAGRNPWSTYGHSQPVGTVVHTDSLLTREEFRECELYRSFLCTWDIDSALIGVIDRAGPQHLGLVVPGPDTGPVDALIAAVRRYLPHIQRATRISRQLGEANLRAANAEAALDSSPSATLVLGANLEVLFANHHARAFLESPIAGQRDGRLALRDRKAQVVIEALANGTDPSPSAALAIENAGDDLWRGLAMRLDTPAASTLAGPIEGGKILLIGSSKPGGICQQTTNRYIEWFGLTPAEARLATLLAQGDSLESAAKVRGVSVNAERFLLRGIFDKTGTKRQGELVALLRDAPGGWIDPASSASKQTLSI